jgi:hypothetical protein
MISRAIFVVLISTLLLSSSGCVRWNAYLQCKAATRQAKQQFKQEELEAKKEEIEAERKAMLAERKMELARRRAECDDRTCQVRSQYEESVRTQLGLDLDQRVKIGQLQVNSEELQQLLQERERDHADRMKVYKQLKDQQLKSQFDQWRQAQTGGQCCQCTGPACDAPNPTCDAPCAPGCCHQCGLPKQPVYSNDCAGNRPFREAPTRPLQEPLTAAQIPMMLPVTIEVGMTNSRIGESRVRRLPQLPLNEPCQQCEGCRKGKGCVYCAPSCDAPGSQPKAGGPTRIPWQNNSPSRQVELPPQPAPPSEVTKSSREKAAGLKRFRLAHWDDEAESDETEE